MATEAAEALSLTVRRSCAHVSARTTPDMTVASRIARRAIA